MQWFINNVTITLSQWHLKKLASPFLPSEIFNHPPFPSKNFKTPSPQILSQPNNLLREKASKGSKITVTKEKERRKRKSVEKERRRKEKKQCLHS